MVLHARGRKDNDVANNTRSYTYLKSREMVNIYHPKTIGRWRSGRQWFVILVGDEALSTSSPERNFHSNDRHSADYQHYYYYLPPTEVQKEYRRQR